MDLREIERLEAVRQVQWRSKITAVERKLVETRAYLRQVPQDANARAEAEKLERMFRELRDHAATRQE